jgi:hypothetical protein
MKEPRVAVSANDKLLAIDERQQATESQLSELTAAVKALEARLAELTKPTPAAVANPAAAPKEEVTPELLVVIAAAVTAFLGKKVRIRSAQLHRPASSQQANPWTLQGRVAIHSSHRPRLRG